jgi:hypothetical protein
MRISALLLMLALTAPAIAQRDDDDVAVATAIAMAKFRTPAPSPVPAPKTMYTDVLRAASEKGVPLITYVGCRELAASIDGVPTGTMYAAVDWLHGYSAKCIVVSVPDGKGWHHGWELSCDAPDAEILARIRRKAVQPMLAMPFPDFRAPRASAGC